MAGLEGVAELLIYGDIGDIRWFGEDYYDVSAKSIAEELKALGELSEISVRINSPGGSVFSAQAIYSLLKSHSARVTVHVDGMAASAASLVAMAGDEIVMPDNAMMMIHSPMSYASGNPSELRKQAEILEKVQDSMMAAYSRSGQSVEDIKAMLEAETWMTAPEAVALGFADRTDEPLDIAASIAPLDLDPSRFKHPPVAFMAKAKEDGGDEKNEDHQKIKEDPEGKSGAKEDEEDFSMTPDELKAKNPELFEAIAKIGEERERARIQAIDGLGALGSLATEAKYEKPCSAEALAVKVLQAQASQGKSALSDMKKDASEIPDVEADASAASGDGDEEKEKSYVAGIRNGIAKAKRRRA